MAVEAEKAGREGSGSWVASGRRKWREVESGVYGRTAQTTL